MRVNRTYSIDMEIAKKLEEQKGNKSEIVNKLLKEYFEKIDDPFEGMTLEELDKEEQKLLIIKEAQERIKALP